MVKTKNANIGREGHGEEGGSSRDGKKGKDKQVARSETPLNKFIPVQAATNYEDWTTKKGKSLPNIESTYQTWEVLQHFKITFFGPNDHIGIGKIYNQNTFKRMGFSMNEDKKSTRGGQEEDSENSEEEEEEEEEEEGNEPEESDSEMEEERIRRETRKKKRQEGMEEGSSSGSMNQVMEMTAFLQTSINTRLDVLDGKISNILKKLEAKDRDEGH
ncbi:hypothetical protein M9H77_27326 [Catharanthus roseus]|uniref:Uncharacterized protein n=1 Tax=Catharanthus roseus TaxID=4058 RepID=A0ACC0AEX9_CATRO|nr:hypothetical protein M9H77_27326 [Catharanthus roseus]